MRIKPHVIVIVSWLVWGHSASANQSPVAGGPVGATDINNALLPSNSGVYLGATEFFGYANRISDNSYDSKPGASSVLISAGYVMYVYSFKLFSGIVASGVQEGYQDTGHLIISHLGKPYQTGVGWRDLYVDFINWSSYVGPLFGERAPAQGLQQHVPYGLTLKAEYSMIFATGHYNSLAPVNPGAGTTFFIPNAAATYLTPPDLEGPVEFDLHIFYDARARNPANDYSNGSLIDFDYAVAQRFGRYAVGLAGSYAVQIQNDTVGPAGHRSPVSPAGDHYELFTLGPILSVPIPSLHGAFKIKAPFAIQARNTLKLNTVVANLFFPF